MGSSQWMKSMPPSSRRERLPVEQSVFLALPGDALIQIVAVAGNTEGTPPTALQRPRNRHRGRPPVS
jgi:hypothetical protein